MASKLRVRVTLAFEYELPAKSDDRERLYGTVDPGRCVAIDLENDPLAFMADTPYEVVSTEVLA